ncbi:response regulator transcription factor [Streptomyces sp. NRRL S-350]|uniref:response regulator transcription factor n=1 Tax=Streptomyces sp. NRRL S-350 TaxID=1463902 RepID=UPI0004C036D5|nr:response regulator transcription factor [Streptomyces sp. NRRL S-350]
MTHMVLIAEDDRAIRDSLARALMLEGYRVRIAANGTQTLAVFAEQRPDVLLLDVMMPEPDGLEVCRRLRAAGDRTPVLMLTARVEVPDRIAGLDAGADDYLVKPFDVAELFARLRALLRRNPPTPAAEVLTVADLRMEPAARRAWRAGQELELSRTEFDLLELLTRHAGAVLDQATLYERIWGYDFGPGSKNLAVFIGYLRRKLDHSGLPPLIHTVRGVGYTLREP